MFQTNPIQLRPVLESDLPIFYQQQIDEEAAQMAGFPPRDHEKFMAHWAKNMADNRLILRTILFEEQVAGNIVSFEQDDVREVGYWLGKDFWGKGIATRALGLFLDVETVRPLYAAAARHNLGSIHVLEKCGFQHLKTADEEVIYRLD
ncbi:MAG: GNAT family N-acetyltransferase [Anaerolineae bacterium]|nr:GNAT family N-acetyltransferase [Anaerolineae bacterium]